MVAALLTWCNPVIQRLTFNYRGYWWRYRWFLLVTCMAAFADMLTTMRFMHTEGIEFELHPAIRIVAGLFGPFAGPALGKAAQIAAIILVTLYARRIASYVFVAATMMYGWAAWYNVSGREMYSPLLFEWLPLSPAGM